MKHIIINALCVLLCLGGFAQEDTLMVKTGDSTIVVQTAENFQLNAVPQNAKQEPVYKLKPAVDIPLTLIAGGWSGFAFTKIYSKDDIPATTIRSLSKTDINSFDRWGASVYSDKAAQVSNIPFYAAMPLPLLLLADKHTRSDIGKIGFMYLEAMSVTGLLYTGSVYLFDRYRPLAYNPEAPMEERTAGGAKNSFFAGHVALVGTSTFFVAKVFSDYHPESKLRYAFWGAAIAATGATGYLRHRAGKHFPSDVLIGTAVGTLSGILVPQLHKNKLFKNPNLSVMPFSGRTHGVAMVYRFDKNKNLKKAL